MSDAAKALGLERRFIAFRGETFPFSDMGPGIRAEFELWLERRAWDALRRSRPSLGEEEYKQACRDLRDDIATGKYSFFEPLCQNMLGDRDAGIKPVYEAVRQMIRLQLGIKDKPDSWMDDVLRECADQIIELTGAPDSSDPSQGRPPETP